MSKPKILVGVLTTYERSGWVCPPLAQWLHKLPYNPNYLTDVGWVHNFAPAAAGRNYLLRHVKELAKESRPDWILMIDNDMRPSQDLLSCIDKAPEDAGVIVPRFYMWDEAKSNPTLCWGVDNAASNEVAEYMKVEPGKYYELVKSGTGAMFLRPQLIDDMGDVVFNDPDLVPADGQKTVQASPGLFYYTYNDLGGRLSTEDICFCLAHVRKTKWKIYGFSDVEIGHYHNVDLAQVAKWLYTNPGKKAEMISSERPSETQPELIARPA